MASTAPLPQEFDHRFVRIPKNGITLHYVQELPPNVLVDSPQVQQLPTLVLVHGWPDLWYGWRHQIKPLAAAGFRVLAPDVRGFGMSDAPSEMKSYSWKNISDDLAGLLDSLNIEKAVFIGHDWGGQIVWRMGLHYPNRVLGVAALLTPYLPKNETYTPLSSLVKHFPSWRYQDYFNTVEAEQELGANVERLFKVVFRAHDEFIRGSWMKGDNLLGTADPPKGRLLSQEELNYFVQQYRDRGFLGGLNLYRTREVVFEEEKGLSANFPEHIPALMVTVGLDPVLPPSLSSKMEQFIPKLKRDHIQDSAHWVQLEHPQKVTSILLSWLTETLSVGNKGIRSRL